MAIWWVWIYLEHKIFLTSILRGHKLNSYYFNVTLIKILYSYKYGRRSHIFSHVRPNFYDDKCFRNESVSNFNYLLVLIVFNS